MGTSLIRNTHPPRIAIGPKGLGYRRVLWGGGGYERGNPVSLASPDHPMFRPRGQGYLARKEAHPPVGKRINLQGYLAHKKKRPTP